jgi:general secretion pathway protein D
MLRNILFLAVAGLVLIGCQTTLTSPNDPLFTEVRAMLEAGQVKPALEKLQQASAADPRNLELRTFYYRVRDNAVARMLGAAEGARLAGGAEGLARAEAAYKEAMEIEPNNARAATGLQALRADRRHLELVTEAEALLKAKEPQKAKAKAQEVLAENASHAGARAVVRQVEADAAKAASAGPKLMNAALTKPVTLEFRDAPLRSIFELLSKRTGLNFIFDREVPADMKASVFVRNTSVEEAVRLLLTTHQLERKVLNDNTMLIYPATGNKQREYRELVVKSFYLANAEAKQTATMIRSLVKTRDLYVDEKLNLVVMRDTPDAVRMAERLVTNQDLGEPEVMLEVEVLEVSRSLLTQYGLQWPNQVNLGIMGASGVAGQITGTEARNFGSGLVRLSITDPLLSLNLKKEDGDTNVLANPRIRVKNKEKAKIHIGDKVPVITTTATSTGFVGESVNYLDIGLKLEVEPTIHLENDVGIKVALEVSSIARENRTPAGGINYQVGTRNASTVLRLKDGETQVLAGLISDEDRKSAARVPGLGDLPTVGKLFSNQRTNAAKTEIVLLITPRVVRNLARPEARLEEFTSGPEGNREGGGELFNPTPLPPIPGTPAPAPAPAPQQGAPAPAPQGKPQ